MQVVEEVRRVHASAADTDRLSAVLADGAPLQRHAIVWLLGHASIDVRAQCASVRDVPAEVEMHRPDIAIIDCPPGRIAEAIAVARGIRREHPATGVLLMAEHVSLGGARDLLQDGGSGVGYLLKERIEDVEDFLGTIRSVAMGGTALDPEVVTQLAHGSGPDDRLDDLTPRERDVLQLVSTGLTNEAVASRLVVSKRAVEKYVGNIFVKLGLQPTSEHERRVLAVLAYQRGMSTR